jgi:N-acetyl-gamma-glutamyl-phosphate reductase
VLKVGIVGGTGYTGVELLRLLAQHPGVEIAAITSRSEAGTPVAKMFSNLRGRVDLAFSEPSIDVLAKCDVVFFATPHGVAMKQTPELLAHGVRVIDLGADFRIADTAVFEKWYGMPHSCPDILAESVYGLPEMNRAAIKKARVVANPGCYPTAVQLGFLPLIKAGVVDTTHLIADAKSGVSGAGRKVALSSLFSESAESFRAYGVSGHRHLPEITQGLTRMTSEKISLTFVPHLLPIIRGIHVTAYARLTKDVNDLQKLYEDTFANEPFVDVMPIGSLPETRSVKGANTCRIAVYRPQGEDMVVVLSVIDNLMKGAAGQAVQNMNIMFDLPETTGLTQIALLP